MTRTIKQVADSNYRNILLGALADDAEKHRNEHLIEHAIKEARTDNTLLAQIMKKMLPDLKSIEAKVESISPFKLVLELPLPGKAVKTVESKAISGSISMPLPGSSPVKVEKPRAVNREPRGRKSKVSK